MKIAKKGIATALLALLGACGTPDSEPVVIGAVTPTDPEPPNSGEPPEEVDKRLSGGDTTVFTVSSSAFETPAPNLEGAQLEKHLNGDVAFEDVFVTAPAPVNSGLGPIFNNSACIRCHPRDGRGRAPEPGAPFVSLFLRISAANDPVPDRTQYRDTAGNCSTARSSAYPRRRLWT